jgi:hypothetical protein
VQLEPQHCTIDQLREAWRSAADLWNGFGPVETFVHKNAVLDRWCDELGQDRREIERSVLLSAPEDIDQIDDFVRAGARHLIVPAKAPFDLSSLRYVLGSARREA